MAVLGEAGKGCARGLVAAIAACSGLGLAACAPDLGTKPSIMPTAELAAQKSLAAPERAWPEQTWWQVYKDAQLDALIARALRDSPDLDIAAARIRRADALVGETTGGLFPTLTGSGSYRVTRQSLTQGFPQQFQSFLPRRWRPQVRAGVDLDWQLDFFGEKREDRLAAIAASDAARAQAASARLQLSTSVAAAYADLAGLMARRAIALENRRLRGETFDLVKLRVEQGLENQGASSRSEAEQGLADLTLAGFDRDITLARHRIAALLGAGPDETLELTPTPDLALPTFGAPADLAANLLGRRPDLTAARLNVEAAARRINVARAGYYPNIRLSGSIGYLAQPPSQLDTLRSQTGSFGPAISLPIFNRSELNADYRRSHADYEEAVGRYDSALIQALRETAGVIAEIKALDTQLRFARQAEAAGRKAYDLAFLRYRGGLSTFIDVLTAEDTLVDLRREVSELTTQAFGLDVALVRALGGGYVAATNKDEIDG